MNAKILTEVNVSMEVFCVNNARFLLYGSSRFSVIKVPKKSKFLSFCMRVVLAPGL